MQSIINLFNKVAVSIDNLNEWIGKTVSWLILALTMLTAWDVAMRYLFRSGSVAMQEMEWHIFSIIFLIGAGYTLKCGAHVRVDIVYARLGERSKAVIDLFGSLIFLIPFSILLIYVSIGFVESSWSVREGSGDPGGLSARYVLKAAIPVGFFLLGLQGVSLALSSLIKVLGPEKSEGSDNV